MEWAGRCRVSVERLDNSRLKATATCSTQCAMHFIYDYVGKEEPAPRRCGADIHRAIAEYVISGDAARAMAVLEGAYARWAGENVAMDDRLAWENVKVVMEEWLRTHPLDKLPFTVAGLPEQGIGMALGDGAEFWALVDVPVRERATGALYVCDHKTTGKITEWWARQFRLGSQMSGYVAALAASTGEAVTGAYINAIEVGKLPVGSDKCRTHKVPKSECMRAHAKWQMLVTTRSAAALQQWRSDALALAGKFRGLKKVCAAGLGMVQYLPQEGMWNGGCTFCDLRDFCMAGRRPELVEKQLVYAPFRPWEKKEAEM